MTGQNVTPEQWDNMTDTERTAHRNRMQRVYVAANGHTMAPYPRWVNGRPIYSSAYTDCVDGCGACRNGDVLPDW